MILDNYRNAMETLSTSVAGVLQTIEMQGRLRR